MMAASDIPELKTILCDDTDRFAVYKAQQTLVTLLCSGTCQEGVNLVKDLVSQVDSPDRLFRALEIVRHVLSKKTACSFSLLTELRGNLIAVVPSILTPGSCLNTDLILYEITSIYLKIIKLHNYKAAPCDTEESQHCAIAVGCIQQLLQDNASLLVESLFHSTHEPFVQRRFRKLFSRLLDVLVKDVKRWGTDIAPDFASMLLHRLCVCNLEGILHKQGHTSFIGNVDSCEGTDGFNGYDVVHIREWTYLCIVTIAVVKSHSVSSDYPLALLVKTDKVVSEMLQQDNCLLFSWLPDVYGDQDDMWIKALVLLLDTLSSCVDFHIHLHCHFLQLVAMFGYDHLSLVDLLISPETSFREYLIKYLRFTAKTWSDFRNAIVLLASMQKTLDETDTEVDEQANYHPYVTHNEKHHSGKLQTVEELSESDAEEKGEHALKIGNRTIDSDMTINCKTNKVLDQCYSLEQDIAVHTSNLDLRDVPHTANMAVDQSGELKTGANSTGKHLNEPHKNKANHASAMTSDGYGEFSEDSSKHYEIKTEKHITMMSGLPYSDKEQPPRIGCALGGLSMLVSTYDSGTEDSDDSADDNDLNKHNTSENQLNITTNRNSTGDSNNDITAVLSIDKTNNHAHTDTVLSCNATDKTNGASLSHESDTENNDNAKSGVKYLNTDALENDNGKVKPLDSVIGIADNGGVKPSEVDTKAIDNAKGGAKYLHTDASDNDKNKIKPGTSDYGWVNPPDSDTESRICHSYNHRLIEDKHCTEDYELQDTSSGESDSDMLNNADDNVQDLINRLKAGKADSASLEDSESDCETEVLDQVMGMLIRLRLQMERLQKSDLLLYNPDLLLSLLEMIESRYESDV